MTAPSPLKEFAGTVALVTGGGSGIGRAIALRYAAGGGDVVVLGRRPEPLAETARLAEEFGVRAQAVSCDVRDADAVTAAVDGVVAEHGRLDALVNNAAGNFVVPAEDLSPGGWRAVVDDRPPAARRRTSRRAAGGRSSTSCSTAASTAPAPPAGTCWPPAPARSST